MRNLIAVVIATTLASAAVQAEFVVPEWESIGAEDAVVNHLLWSDWHGWNLFLATPDGYLFRNEGTAVWSDLQEPGVPGREVTALTMVPRLQHRVLTGRLGADGRGSIEMSFPVKGEGRDQVVYAGQAGPVCKLLNRAFYDPTLYAATRALGDTPGALIASADSGLTWHEITGHGHHDLTDLFCWYNDVLYVAGDAGVMYTHDGGATWQPRNDGLPAGTVLHLWIDGPAIAIPDKDEEAHLYASLADGVYYTATDVIQWQQVLDDPAPRQILVQPDPYRPADLVYVVTHDGRLLVAWRGEWQWTDLTGSLTGLDIVGLMSEYYRLTVATAHDGVFRGNATTGGTDVPEFGAGFDLNAAPNPFNPCTTVRFALPAAGVVQATIFDARGRMVQRLIDEVLTAGPHSVIWSGQALPSGTYLCRLTTPWGVEVRKLELVR